MRVEPGRTVQVAEAPAAVRRRQTVEAAFREHERQLSRLHDDLVSAAEPAAPEVAARLRREPPVPVPHGYGLLPALRSQGAATASPARATVMSYSWPITERYLRRDEARVAALDGRLRDLAAGRVGAASLTAMADEYEALDRNRRLIDAHIEHNRLWQADIPVRRAMYDTNTALYDLALERNAVRDQRATASGDVAAALDRRDAALTARLAAGVRETRVPAFVRVERVAPRRWAVHVPLVTDIADATFIDMCRQAIESHWRLEAGEDHFEVRLHVTTMPLRGLYAGSQTPAAGEAIDVASHVSRFPRGAGILTTGGRTTHVWGQAIVLGSQPLSTTVLAHEFGHLLGFADRYVRGYRELGDEGFEILEAVLDAADLMSAPETGRVRREHFERLLTSG